MMTISRMTATTVVEGLKAIFSATATATAPPAETEGIQEVGLTLAEPLGAEHLRHLLMLSEITRTQVTLQGVESRIRVIYSAPQPTRP